MILDEANKLVYLEKVFKHIREFDGIGAHSIRINLLKNDTYNKDDEVLFKRWRWFSLLSESNDIFQNISQLKPEEQLEILKEIQKHPYFDHFVNKKLLLQLIKKHKEFQEILNEQPKEVSDIFFGLYHLKSDVHNQAIAELQELCESPKERRKLLKAVSKIKKQIPELHDNFKEIYQALGVSKVSSYERIREQAKSLPWYSRVIITYFLIKLIVLIIAYFSS